MGRNKTTDLVEGEEKRVNLDLPYEMAKEIYALARLRGIAVQAVIKTVLADWLEERKTHTHQEKPK